MHICILFALLENNIDNMALVSKTFSLSSANTEP